MEDARNGKFNAVIFYSLDRLGRTVSIITNIINKFKEYDITFASCREGIDTSSAVGKFVLNIFASIAELDHNNTLERLKEGKNYRKFHIDGDTGGTLPYGYMRIEKKTTIDMEACNLVNRIYRLYYFSDKTAADITRILNKEKILSPTKKEWKDYSVSRILKFHRDKYMGGFRDKTSFRWPRLLEEDIVNKIIEERDFEHIPSFCTKNGEYIENKKYEDMVWDKPKSQGKKEKKEKKEIEDF